MQHRYSLSFLLLLLLPLSAVAQLQVQVDTISDVDRIVDAGTVTSNGDRILVIHSATGKVLWRCGTDGTPLWARQVGTGSGSDEFIRPTIAADDQGGALLLLPFSEERLGANWNDPDTMRYTLSVHRLAANGDQSWEKHLTLDMPDGYSPGTTAILTQAADGSIYVAMTFALQSAVAVAAKLSADGQLLWVTQLGTPDYGWAWGAAPRLQATGGQAGGLYLASVYSEPGHEASVAHLSTAGVLDWAYSFTYTNAAVIYEELNDMTTLPDGSVIVLGRMDIPDHVYLHTFGVDLQGQLTDAHFYVPPPLPPLGDRWIASHGNGNLLLGADTLVAELAPSGEVLNAVMVRTAQQGQERQELRPLNMAVASDGAAFLGYMASVDITFGFTHWSPITYTVDPASSGCSNVPVTMDHALIPESYITRTARTDLVGQSLPATITDGPATNVPRALLSGNDLCALITGVAAPQAPENAAVVNTLVLTGDPIRMRAGAGCRVSVLDVQGRVVLAERTFGPGASPGLSTSGWSAGVYVVRIAGLDGGAVRAQRVVVQ